MKKINSIVLTLAIIICGISCEKDHFSTSQEMVYLNDIEIPLSEIDYDNDNLTVLFLDDSEIHGRMYTDKELMTAWIEKHEESKSILESLEKSDKIKAFIKNNNLDDENIPLEERQTTIDKYANKITNNNSRIAIKINVYQGTGYTGPSATYYGPTIRLYLGSFADNLRSFKAWGSGPLGEASFYKNPNLGGARLFYYRGFFRKKSTLGSFNNDVESFVNL